MVGKSDGLVERNKKLNVDNGLGQGSGQNSTDNFHLQLVNDLFAHDLQLQHSMVQKSDELFLNSTIEDETFVEQPRGFLPGKRPAFTPKTSDSNLKTVLKNFSWKFGY